MYTLEDIIRRTRSRLDDMLQPYLWSDAELKDIINDTIRDASTRAGLVVHSDYPIVFTQNPDLTWKNRYALPSTVLHVHSVRLASQPNVELMKTSYQKEVRYSGYRPSGIGRPHSYVLDDTTVGTGDDYGVRARAITFIGTPYQADTALLQVRRLPELLCDNCDSPEIDDIWIPDLIYGITAMAYLKRDTDTFDPQKSQRDFSVFDEKFGIRISAHAIRERQTDVPQAMMVY